MFNFIIGHFDFVVAACTILVRLLAMKKIWFAPIAGLGLQVIWVSYAWIEGQWGFLVVPCIMVWIYGFSVKPWSAQRYEHEFAISHKKDYIKEEHTKHPDWEYKNGSS